MQCRYPLPPKAIGKDGLKETSEVPNEDPSKKRDIFDIDNESNNKSQANIGYDDVHQNSSHSVAIESSIDDEFHQNT